MIRILVFGMTENPGGVESFLMNYYRHIDKNKIQFDFLCNSYNKVAYEDELISLGGRVYHITSRSKNYIKFTKELKELFDTHSSEWDGIWVNVCSLANIDYLKYAKKYGIKKRIIHSHNSHNMDGRLRGLLHEYYKSKIDKYATDFWACSEEAAYWFYKEKLMKKAVVIRNAIDVNEMSFDNTKREKIRKDNGWEDKFVIGNIGRLHFQKNQEFAIDVFDRFHKKNQNSVLVLIGQGEDEEKLKNKVNELGLKESVVFAGIQTDIQGWLSSMDLFLFPSVFEGLSVVTMEAQANGVPILASNGVIPREVKINDNFVFLNLNRGADFWAKAIYAKKLKNRKDIDSIKDRFIEKGFDITNEVRKLEQLLMDK